MSFAHTVGRAVGTSAAYAYEGTRLASTSFAQGAREGYAEKAQELRAKREALGAVRVAPALPKQRKVAA
jgi:hypothetical protein